MRYMVVLIVPMLMFLGCGNRQESSSGNQKYETDPSIVTLRLGYRPKALADVTPQIMEELLPAPEGFELELVAVPSPAAALQQLEAGTVDAVAGIPLAAIIDELEANKSTFEAYLHQFDLAGEGWVSLVANTSMGINTIEDLANVPVAALPTEQAQWLLRRIMLAAGIPENSISISVYNPLTPLAGLEAKEHGAIFGLEPALSEAEARGYKIISKGPVSHYLYDDKPVLVSASLISKSFAKRNPKALAIFLGLASDAIELRTKSSDAVRILFVKREYGELTEDVARRLFLPIMKLPTAEDMQLTQRYLDDLTQAGLASPGISLEPLFPNLIPKK